MNIEQIFELVVGLVAIGSAVFMIVARNMVMSILGMILNFLCIAILYLTLEAQFVAVLQVLVYAGGIIVLFLFVIMLLNIRDTGHTINKFRFKTIFAVVLGAGILVEMAILIFSSTSSKISSLPVHAAKIGTVESIGKSLFTDYVLPFEAASFLLLAAIIGALVLAKKKFN